MAASALAAQPIQLPIQNPGFEDFSEDKLPDAWIVHSAGNNRSPSCIDDSVTGINQAKQGSNWLRLDNQTQVGQLLNLDKVSRIQSGDYGRLFVSFILCSVQDSGGNDMQLSVSLYASKSDRDWINGEKIASAVVDDTSNDNRSDPNSYVDAYAVLRTGNLAGGKDRFYWLVIENTQPKDSSSSAVTIDNVEVNLAGPPPAQDGMPNILIVFQDDMGYGDASCNNPQSRIPTANLDRLAGQGMRLTDAHAAATICGPSRVGLLTGTIPDKLGVHGNFVEGGKERLGPPTLSEDTPTIATLCQNAGYDTAVVGKWGIPSNWDVRVRDGATEELNPDNAASILDFNKPIQNAEMFGFAYRYIYDEQRPFILGETAPFENNPQPYGWHENGYAVRDILTHTSDQLHESYLRAITDRAVRYIQTKAGLRGSPDEQFRIRDPQAPFYLHYLTHAPHLPLVPASQFKGRSQAGDYGDFVINLDYSLGRLMKALDDCGMAGNTLVIFSADNGPEHFAYGRIRETGHYSMGQWRGVKRDLYEGGHRVPTVVRWPREIKPGTISDALVSMTDWYATVAAITGQVPDPSTGLDSVNLMPVLTGSANQVRGLLLQDCAVGDNSRSIRSGEWVYIDAPTGELNRNKEPQWFREQLGVTDAEGNELFNLGDDPAQSRNLIREAPERAQRLQDLLNTYWRPGVRSTPAFDQQKDSDGDGYSDFYESIVGSR